MASHKGSLIMGLAVLPVGRLEIGCLCNYDSVYLVDVDSASQR